LYVDVDDKYTSNRIFMIQSESIIYALGLTPFQEGRLDRRHSYSSELPYKISPRPDALRRRKLISTLPKIMRLLRLINTEPITKEPTAKLTTKTKKQS
jgi:hypothetical protein